jgi:hypothetical protein
MQSNFQHVKITRKPSKLETTVKHVKTTHKGKTWERGTDVLSNASYTDDKGNVFTLYQDGDLWAICFDKMTDGEKENFGFELDCGDE